jgi:type IV pilus assembly protein PilB
MTNSSSSRRALVLQRSFSPFGNKLIQAGYVDSEQMQKALAESRRTGQSLTDVLESITGQQLAPELLRQYKKQQLFELKILYGLESLDPELSEISTGQIASLIDTVIPVDVCRRHRLLPLSQEQGDNPSVLVAMVDPENLEAQDDLNRILRPKNLGLRRMVITVDDYQRIISSYLDEAVAKQQKEELDAAVDVNTSLDELDFGGDGGELQAVSEEEADLGAALQDAGQAPVIALVNKILVKALQEGVSDIHVEPQEEYLRVRFRKDGVLNRSAPQNAQENHSGGYGPIQNYFRPGYCRTSCPSRWPDSTSIPGA